MLSAILGSEKRSIKHEKAVDFQKVEVKIAPLLSNQSIMGWGSYEFEVYRKTDSIFLDAVAMKFQSVNLNGRAINSDRGSVTDYYQHFDQK